MVNPTPPVFLFIGEERYLKDKTINDLRSSLVGNSSGELDYKVLYAPDTSAEEILDCASTIPFFSSRRLIVVKDFERLPKEDVERLLAYIKTPNEHTCLVLDAKTDDIVKRNPALARHARVVRFSGLTGAELSSWIAKSASSRGKTIEPDAIETLRDGQSGGLLGLSQELEKLAAFTGRREKITKDDVERVVGKNIIASTFDIAKAVGEKNISRAMAITHELVSSGKKPHEIIGMIAWYFKAMAKIKALTSDGRTEFYISQILKMSRSRVRELMTQADVYSSDQVGAKLGILLDADLAIKRAKYLPALILEFAIIRLCRARCA